MITSLMNLTLPTPTVTIGPQWATELNEALANGVDSHDHTAGKGAKIPTAALNLNANLPFNNYSAFGLASLQLNNTVSTTSYTGLAYALSIFSSGGNLYYTNSGGTPVQITSGASVVTPPGANVNTFEFNLLSSNTTLTLNDLASTDYPLQAVNTSSSSITITLPAAGTAAAGRFFIIKDYSGNSETYPISIAPVGLDTIDLIAGSFSLESNSASIMLVSDGVSNWLAV